MTNRGSIYLCGPMTGLNLKEAKYGWRQDVHSVLRKSGIACYSPLRHLRPEEMEEPEMTSMNPNGAGVCAQSTPRGLTERDRFDVLRADLIFCNLLGATRISVGSMIELGWADANRIPIVGVMEKDNIHAHGMVTAICSWIVPTLLEGIGVVQDLFSSEL